MFLDHRDVFKNEERPKPTLGVKEFTYSNCIFIPTVTSYISLNPCSYWLYMEKFIRMLS